MYIILNLMNVSTVFSNSTETTFSLSLFLVIQEYHFYLTFGILYYIFYHVSTKICSLRIRVFFKFKFIYMFNTKKWAVLRKLGI